MSDAVVKVNGSCALAGIIQVIIRTIKAVHRKRNLEWRTEVFSLFVKNLYKLFIVNELFKLNNIYIIELTKIQNK